MKTYELGSRMKKTIVIALAASVLLSGCATVTRGRTQTWNIVSTPAGASVRTTIGIQCEATPCSFTIARKSAFGVTVTKPGYKTFTGQVTNKISGRGGAGMAGNILAGGIIGIGVDAATGSALDLDPNPMTIILEANDSSAESRLAPPVVAAAPTKK
jgi:hypothetical protein